MIGETRKWVESLIAMAPQGVSVDVNGLPGLDPTREHIAMYVEEDGKRGIVICELLTNHGEAGSKTVTNENAVVREVFDVEAYLRGELVSIALDEEASA